MGFMGRETTGADGAAPRTAPEPGGCGRSPFLVTMAAAAAAAAVVAADATAGRAVFLSALAVFPVAVTGWCAPVAHAVALAVAAAGGAFAVRPDAAGAWSALALLAVLLAAAVLPGRARAALAGHAEAAATDPLTGALNRRAFQEAAERERLRAERRGEPISVAYLDLDGFKELNDRRGHQAGDRILEELAARVMRTIRGTDLFCRIGGDEFALLLPDTDAREAAAVLQRARRTLGDEETPVTSSIGIATFRIVPTTVGAMVDAADELMYRAKRLGKDRIVGSVIAGPWLRWDGVGSDGAVDAVTVDVEIVPARTAG
ncbi:MAG: GGDEF domain-containing protein [Actinobacteria bacterium]|nr:GGDEF domain-containing protein [Actinomycetota bacterium]